MPLRENYNFDGIDWINQYFNDANVDFNNLRPVLSFSLMWNLFESKACNRSANPGTIKTSVYKADLAGKLERNKYQPYVDYFRNRYLDEDRVTDFFMSLLLTNEKHRKIVEEVLRGEKQDTNNVVYSLLLIAHRIRNNLFHGNKEISQLHFQTELFQVINNLLADYIEDITHAR